MANPTLFSVGRDIQAVIQHPLAPNGGRLDLQHVTGFRAQPKHTQVSVKRLDGNRLTDALPDGWDGSFDIDRGNQNADAFCTALEENYFAGGPRVRGTITTYITETDGSVTTHLYQDCAMWLTNAGEWKDDAVVKMNLSFSAPRRRLVA